MLYGLTIFPTEYSIQPARLAAEAESRGFESLWFAEHTHIPACRSTPWPGGSELPKEYYDLYDPFIALTAAAAATERLKVGAGVCLVVQHDPIVLAKTVATLDRISEGRLLLGVGGGWNAEEMANHGTDFKSRWKLLRERVEAMKAIWTRDKAEYHGELVDFGPIYSRPKPFTSPHPPIYIGGGAPWALGRAARYCDGWMPIGMRDEVIGHIPALHRAAEEAGREPGSLEVLVYGSPADGELLERYRDAGVKSVIFWLPPAGEEEIKPLLDSYGELAERVG
jgi:probable F420-dependent oxidoreductase